MKYQDDRIEKHVYDPYTRVVLTLMPFFSIAVFIWSSINGIEEFFQQQYGKGITAVVLGIFMGVCMVFFIKYLFKYRFWSSKLIIDKKGVNYRSKVKDYFLSWDEVKRIEVKGFGIHTTYTYFYSSLNDRKIKTFKDEENKIVTKGFFYTFLDFRDLEYIEKHWRGNIKLNSSFSKYYKKYKERKKKSMLKKSRN